MSTDASSPLERFRQEIESWVEAGFSNPEILNFLKEEEVTTSDTSLRRALKRWGIVRIKVNQAGTKYDGDTAEVTTEPKPTETCPGPIDHEEALRDRGLDPADWEVERLTVNEWDAPTGDRLRQLKVTVRRKTPIELIIPARTEGYKRPKPTKRASSSKTRKVVLVGDQQAPHHDRRLHELFLQFLADERPDEGVLIGDTMDLADISRHARNPEWGSTTQLCIDSAYFILLDYVCASEATKWTKLKGNHDARIRTAILNHLPDFYQLRRGGDENSHNVWEIPHLLRLDELGIEYEKANGSWEHAQVKISPYLAARHGWIAVKGSGSSALKTLEHLGYSCIVGHTHRQGIVYKTTHDIHGAPTTLTAVETGCMCQIKDGLGYAVAPDWQNGFAVANVWPDGTFKVDTATYVDGVLLYRDKRYS